MSFVDAPMTPLDEVRKSPSRLRSLLSFLRKHPQAAIGFVILMLFVFVAIFVNQHFTRTLVFHGTNFGMNIIDNTCR